MRFNFIGLRTFPCMLFMALSLVMAYYIPIVGSALFAYWGCCIVENMYCHLPNLNNTKGDDNA